MASNAPFTVTDSNTIAHVYSPSGINDNRASYQNLAESMLSGRETVQIAHKDGKTVRENTLMVRMPKVVETTIDGVTRRTVENFGSGSVKLLVPPEWTSEECETLRSVVAAAVLSAPFVAMNDLGEFVW